MMRDWKVDKDRGKAIVFAYWQLTKDLWEFCFERTRRDKLTWHRIGKSVEGER